MFTVREIMRSLAVALVLTLAGVVCYFAFQMPVTELQCEVTGFLYHYTSERSFGAMIFDPAINDWGMYQARELSYVLDALDAKFILCSWVNGSYHLLSFSSVILLGLTVFMQQLAMLKFFPGVSQLERALCSLVYVLLPCAMLEYFRSAKHLAAFFATAFVILLFDMLRKKLDTPVLEKILFFLVLFLASLSDRQGFFLAAAASGGAGLLCIYAAVGDASGFCRHKRDLYGIAAAALAAYLASCAYNVVIGPALIRAFNGYTPDFTYQRLPWSSALQTGNFVGAELFFGSNVGQNLTCVSQPFFSAQLGVCIVFLLAMLLAKKRKYPLLAVFLFTVFCMAVCAFCMVLRHPFLTYPLIVFGTYFLPFASILFFFVVEAGEPFPRKYRLIYAALLAAGMLLGKAASSPKERREMGCFVAAEMFFQVLDSGESEIRRYPLPYRCRLLAERICARRNGGKSGYVSAGAAE